MQATTHNNDSLAPSSQAPTGPRYMYCCFELAFLAGDRAGFSDLESAASCCPRQFGSLQLCVFGCNVRVGEGRRRCRRPRAAPAIGSTTDPFICPLHPRTITPPYSLPDFPSHGETMADAWDQFEVCTLEAFGVYMGRESNLGRRRGARLHSLPYRVVQCTD